MNLPSFDLPSSPIDLISLVLLLVFPLLGCLMGPGRVLLSLFRTFGALLVGGYLGLRVGCFLGETFHRPRAVLIPLTASFFSILIVILLGQIDRFWAKKQREKWGKRRFFPPLKTAIPGGLLGLFYGIALLLPLLWSLDWMTAGTPLLEPILHTSTAQSIRVEQQLNAHWIAPLLAQKVDPEQAHYLATSLTTPKYTQKQLKQLGQNLAFANLYTDHDLLPVLLSKDASAIYHYPPMNDLLNDPQAMTLLRNLGVISPRTNRHELCDQLATWGANETIRTALLDLHERDMFSRKNLPRLPRDPAFDQLIGQWLKCPQKRTPTH